MSTDDRGIIVSDPSRLQPIVVQRRDNTWVIHTPRTTLFLSDDEAGRLVSALTGRAHLERYSTTTPAKARLAQCSILESARKPASS